MSELGRGEIHFINEYGAVQVEPVPSFEMPERHHEESVPEFKARVTAFVTRHGIQSRGRKVVEVKWVGPLGYHFGYLDAPVVNKIKHGELPKFGEVV